jgi:AbrB family looped-hinge helix DNA binding protein
MDRTRISSKGQIVIPKQIRDRHRWKPGTELAVIDAASGVRIEALQRGKTLTAGDVFGCLQHKGKPLPIDRLAAPVKLGKKDFR